MYLELLATPKTGVTCLYAEIGRSGTGGAAFKSNSEAGSGALDTVDTAVVFPKPVG